MGTLKEALGLIPFLGPAFLWSENFKATSGKFAAVLASCGEKEAIGKLGNDRSRDSSSGQRRESQSQVSTGFHALGNRETSTGFHKEPEIFRNTGRM